MEMGKLGREVIKQACDGSSADSAVSGPNAISDIWISPSHWKAMGSEKQAVVVDLYHRRRSHELRFPFDQMDPVKKADGNKVTSSYDIGITFSVGKDIRSKTILEALKALKIPHLASSWETINKKRQNLSSKG